MGMTYPNAIAALRNMKAEGGWAVICTEETEVHPTGDLSPLIEGRLWEDGDIPIFDQCVGRGVSPMSSTRPAQCGYSFPSQPLCHCKSVEPTDSKPYLRVTRQIVAQVFGLK